MCTEMFVLYFLNWLLILPNYSPELLSFPFITPILLSFIKLYNISHSLYSLVPINKIHFLQTLLPNDRFGGKLVYNLDQQFSPFDTRDQKLSVDWQLKFTVC